MIKLSEKYDWILISKTLIKCNKLVIRVCPAS